MQYTKYEEYQSNIDTKHVTINRIDDGEWSVTIEDQGNIVFFGDYDYLEDAYKAVEEFAKK